LFESSPTLPEESPPVRDSTVVHTCVPGGSPVTLPVVDRSSVSVDTSVHTAPSTVDCACVSRNGPVTLPAVDQTSASVETPVHIATVHDSTVGHACVPGNSPVTPVADRSGATLVHTALVDTPSQNQFNPSEYPEVEAFVNNSCGCDLADDEPCSGLFSVEHYVNLRAQCCLLSKDELDMVLMGSIMSTVNIGDKIHDGRHKPAKRQRVTINFMHEGNKVCKKTFLFLYGIGKKRLQAVKSHYKTNGLEQREHGNKRNSPHNYSYDQILAVHKFLINYAEDNAILLPGRVPGHKRDDIKLLPSNCSKKENHTLLLQVICTLLSRCTSNVNIIIIGVIMYYVMWP